MVMPKKPTAKNKSIKTTYDSLRTSSTYSGRGTVSGRVSQSAGNPAGGKMGRRQGAGSSELVKGGRIRSTANFAEPVGRGEYAMRSEKTSDALKKPAVKKAPKGMTAKKK